MSGVAKDLPELSPLKKAFLKIEEMQAKLQAAEEAKREPIAVVGLGCRLPNDIHDPEAFWRLLREGVDAVKEIPRERWDADAYFDPDPAKPGKMITKCGAFLEGVDRFDAPFFGISPREAMSMDPQQRLLLEVMWEALEHAGQAPDKLMNSRTGVFLAMCKVDYAHLLLKQNDPALLDTYFASGNAYSTAAGRISYVLGLQGPCLTVDTACSSSLVVVHLACQSLRSGESKMALAGGVNLVLSPDNTITFSKANMLAVNGRCKTFDAAADGFVQGDGCGMIVLKRLSDALADGDRIHALIRGSAINQDGASSGLTAPSGPAQEAVILEALAQAGLRPADVGYVETHGTGTTLGDPIEVQAIGAALGRGRTQENPVLIGAVKTNLGHLEGAAGITGLIKVVLSLQHRQIPPTLHFTTPNPFIPWEQLPVRVVTELVPFPALNGRRIAGVSSFGFSGTNAHVVLEEYSEQRSVVGDQLSLSSPQPSEAFLSNGDRPCHLLALSAKSDNALQELAGRYVRYLAENPNETLADVCYSANAGRAHLSHRLAVAAANIEELRSKLSAFTSGQAPAGMQRGFVETEDQPKIAFLFTGQGAQYHGMGRLLYETQPVFRKALQACDEILRSCLEKPLLAVIGLPSSAAGQRSSPDADYRPPEADDLLDQTAYTQPALFAIEYALAKLWESWGVAPAMVMGHSVGEYVAACIAGVFSLEDGLGLIAARGRLMQALPQNGAMAAIFAGEARVAETIAPYRQHVAIAAINGPDNVVISGLKAAVEEILQKCAAQGLKSKTLKVSHAFHSPLMDPMLDEFAHLAGGIKHAVPRMGFISNLTGRPFDFRFNDPQSALCDPRSYWRRHVREAVQFAASVRTLHEKGCRIFVEIGPHATLLGMAGKCLPQENCVWAPSLRQGKNDWQQLLDSLGLLYVHGVNPDWKSYDRDYARRKLVLPAYPFQRKRYWFAGTGPLFADGGMKASHAQATIHEPQATHVHPLLGHRLHAPLLREVLFQAQWRPGAPAFIADHQVHGVAVLPTTAYLEMITAAAEALGPGPHGLEDMEILEALILDQDEVRTVQLLLSPQKDGSASFQIISFAAAENNGHLAYKTHARGKIPAIQAQAPAAAPALHEWRALCAEELPVAQFYRHLHERGLQFGPRFLGINRLWRHETDALGQIRLTAALAAEAGSYGIHPAFLDACLQVVGAIMAEDKRKIAADDIFMPIGLQAFRLHASPGEELWSHATIRKQKDDGKGAAQAEPANSRETRVLDFHIYDPEGRLIAEVLGLQVKRAAPETLRRQAGAKIQDWLYEVKWEPRPLEGKTSAVHAADYLPVNAEIAARLRQQLPQLSAAHNLRIYDQILPRLDALSLAYVLQAFTRMNWKFVLGQHFATRRMAEALGVIPAHHRLLHRLLEMLAEEGFLKNHGAEWEVRQLPHAEAPADLARSFAARFAGYDAEFNLLQRGGQNLAEVLRGQNDPLHVLFPGGSFAVAEKLYDESAAAKTYNGLARHAITMLSSRLPRDRKLRVLEVGAGTGGTTSFILPDFPAERTEYVFTDLSPLFMARAKEKFKEHSFVRYELLDIEQEPEAQGFAPHEFDLVIAANVVHATKDLRQTLGNIARLLVPEGLLLLLEGMSPQRWIDLTFGMTEGWWRFTDTDIRPGYPLIPPQRWQALLEEVGFTQFEATPREADAGRALSQNAVILARAPRAAMRRAEGRWLIFADENGAAEKLAAQLAARGEACLFATAADAFAMMDAEHYQLDPARPADFKRLLHEAFTAPQVPCRGVVLLWPLDEAAGGERDAAHLSQAQHRGSRSVLHLVQALLSAPGFAATALWIATRGAQPVTGEEKALAVSQAPIWGMGRALALEHPELRCVRLDFDPVGEADDIAQALFEEILARDAEDQVAYRRGQRYVARLARMKIEDGRSKPEARHPLAASHEARSAIFDRRPVQLEITKPGVLDGLALRPMPRRAPGLDEIEIRVLATGLNFRDVLNVLGMRNDDDPLGGEIAGVVARVGENVRDFKIGDEVVAITVGGFSTYLTTRTELAAHKPGNIGFAEAVTVPLAFLTAHYALHTLGKIAAGERVLIHAAAGGVGMAAVQLAHRAGAEIFATAGNAEKREYLEAMGIRHVFNSRTLEFADKIAALLPTAAGKSEIEHETSGMAGLESKSDDGGAPPAGNNSPLMGHDLASSFLASHSSEPGLDLVLNSLTGEFIPKSLALLRAGGRFLEIGKKEIWTRAQVAQVNPRAEYFAVDLAEKIKSDPGAVRPLFLEIMRAIANGELEPLPHKTFPLEDAAGAFRYMAQARHIGKVVVTQEVEAGARMQEVKMLDGDSRVAEGGAQAALHDPPPTIHHSRTIALRAEATYLITGGLSGLGLLVAEWLVERGARHLALVGRRGPSEEARVKLAELEHRGAQIKVMCGDVARAGQMAQIMAEIEQAMPPLRGLIHSAGVLDDGVVLQQTWERFAGVMAPKVEGAWHLHALTSHLPLDFFVLFSSVSALLGSPAQINHSAANAFLDALAHHRHALGLPAMSINWGAWSEIGAAARHKVGERIAVRGIGSFTPQQGLEVLELLFQNPVTQAGVMPVDWVTFGRMFSSNRIPPYFSGLMNAAPAPSSSPRPAPDAPSDLLQQLRQASAARRQKLLLSHVEKLAMKVLSMDSSQTIHAKQPLTDLGLDSLMAVELRNLLGTSLGLQRALPATLVFDYPTTAAIAGYLAQELFGEEKAASATEADRSAPAAAASTLDDLEQLSDEEVERLFAEKMQVKT